MKNFVDDLGITGHLTIIKKHKNGEEEVIFDDHNIIVSGMGVALSYLFTASGSNSILDYQVDRFQLGVSGPPAGGVGSSIYELSGTLGDSYGGGSNLFIEKNTQITSETDTLNRYFALIPANKITKIGDSSVRYTLVVDEEACNDLVDLDGDDTDATLSEIGLFAKNPRGDATNASILVAYRTFSIIRKTSDFSLIFRWTLNF